MKKRFSDLFTDFIAVAILSCTANAWAIESGATANDWPYLSGGVSQEELAELKAQRAAYSLWVLTAAAKSGAFLVDVRVTLRRGEQRQVVFYFNTGDEVLPGRSP